MVGHITFALFVVFASRSVFNFVSAAGDVDVTVNTDAVGDNIASFTIYAFWELFPVSLLLVTVASGGPVLPAIYRKRQFGVKGSGAVTRGHTHPSAMNRSNNTNTGDAMSSLTSYEVYMESPGPLSRENSYRYAAVVPSHDDTGIQVIGETVESELKGTPGRRSKHSRRHDKHDIRVELDDVNDYSDVDVAADVRVTVRDSKHVETVDLLQPLLRSEQLRPAVSPVLDVSDMSVGSRPTVRSQPIATRSHDSNGFTVTRGASNLSQGRNGSRGGKRGLAAGAKARIVSLGGDEPGYDGYPVYTEFVGSYGGVGSYSEQPSPSLRPYSRGNTHSDPPPPPAWNVY